MAAKGSLSSCSYLRLFGFLFHISLTLTYSLKDCVIQYNEDPSAGLSLDCASRKLTTIPDYVPKDAVSIQIQGNLIQKINKRDFLDLTKLRTLYLTQNLISSVDDGAFVDLVWLETLYMMNNNLTILTKNMFQGLINLANLDLSSNNIQFIHNSAFWSLTNLQTLTLDENLLQQVADIQPILQLPQIQTLNLRCNQFSSFETKDLLMNLSSSLKELRISGRNLKKFSITTTIFPYLQKLDFSACFNNMTLKWDIPDKTLLRNITHLTLHDPVFSFKGIQKVLQSLDSLNHLRLTLLDEWIENGLLSKICKIATLMSLYLSGNQLGNSSLKLAPCSQLRELDLSRTSITELPEGSIQSMTRLRSLMVSRNQLTKVPRDVQSLASLEVLYIDNNLISELSCEDFVNTTNLTKLYLGWNHLSKLDRCVFESLTNLKLLDLGNNFLTTLTGTFSNVLQKLESLDISQNFLLFIKNDDFRGLESLKYLMMDSLLSETAESKAFNGLKNLEDLTTSLPPNGLGDVRELNQMKNLRVHLNYFAQLKMTHSNIFKDPSVFTYLKSLIVICSRDLSYIFPVVILHNMKHLESFEVGNVHIDPESVEMFQFNSQLKSMILTHSDLPSLNPELFLPVPKLQTLDLFQNKIKSLDFLLQANLTALRCLKVTDNELAVINETVFTSLPSLTYLDLSNNPFTCECSNAGFIQWVKNNKQTQVVNAHQYKCSFPVDKQGTLLLDFDIQSCWNDVSFFYFLSSTCLVVLTLLTSFIYHFLRWQLVYTFHLFLAFLYDSRRRKKGDLHQFDAFVSYNIHDEDWVHREMLPVLEGEQGWRLCLHHRDFQPGKPIIENITDAIYGSRKTICVISRHYLQSEWCSREIQMASFRLFDEQNDVLILLFLEEIPPHHLSPYYRMRKLVKKRSYLSWPQAARHPGVFWQNVQRALQTGDALTEDTDLLTGPTGR